MVRNEAIHRKLENAKKIQDDIVETQEELDKLKELIDARVRWYELLISLEGTINALVERLHETE